MFARIHEYCRRLRSALGCACSGFQSGFRAAEVPGASETPGSGANSVDPAAGLPPVTGSTEEQFLLWQMPPAAFLKKKALTSVGADGQIPESAESMQLTAAGKVLGRVDFLVMDHFGTVGRPDELKGRCVFCQKVTFKGANCDICGLFVCPQCGAYFEQAGTIVYLCKQHHRAAEWNRDLWADAGPDRMNGGLS